MGQPHTRTVVTVRSSCLRRATVPFWPFLLVVQGAAQRHSQPHVPDWLAALRAWLPGGELPGCPSPPAEDRAPHPRLLVYVTVPTDLCVL